MSTQYICASAVGAVGATGDEATHEPPACKPFDYDWSEQDAIAHGYSKVRHRGGNRRPVLSWGRGKVWGTAAANAIVGTDASQYEPNEKIGKLLSTYINDIYRSAYLGFNKEYTWKGIRLRRYGLQVRDASQTFLSLDD
jgi:hypothetical protein